MKKRILFLSLIISLFSVSLFSGSEEDNVKATFSNYKKSILAKDGKNAVRYLSKETINYYAKALDLTLNADKESLNSEPILMKLNVLLSRHLLDKETLKNLDGKGYIIVAIEKGLIGEDSVKATEIGEVTIDGEKATSKISANGRQSPIDYLYRKEKDGWKLDFVYLLEKIEPMFKMMVQNSGKDENKFIISIIERRYGITVSEDIWKPLNS